MEIKQLKEIDFYKVLGKFFTDKKQVGRRSYQEKYSDEKEWRDTCRKRGDTYKYGISELNIDKNNFEGFKISTKEINHNYEEKVHCPIFGDYQYTANRCDSQVVLNINKGHKKLTLEGNSIYDIRESVFRELRLKNSLMQYWDEKGLLKDLGFCKNFFERLMVINGEEYWCNGEELESTPEVDEARLEYSRREREKPKVDLTKTVRFPDNRFWQPYSVAIKLSGFGKYRLKENLDHKIEFSVVADTLKELTNKYNNLYVFIKKGVRNGTGYLDPETKIYLGHKNVKYHRDADELVSMVEEFQGRAKSIDSKIRELKRMPHNKIRGIHSKRLPVGEEEFLSLC